MLLADEQRKVVSEIYIANPSKRVCLRSLTSTNETTHVFTQNTIYPPFFANKRFLHHNVSRLLPRRSGYYFIDIFPKETWMVVSMNEKSSAPKGMKC